PGQYKIGIRGIYPSDKIQVPQGLGQFFSSLEGGGHFALHPLLVQQPLIGPLLGQLVDVVGRFDLVQVGNDIWGGITGSQSYARHAIGLGQGLDHNQIGIIAQLGQPSVPIGEIDIGLIDDDQAVEGAQQGLDAFHIQGISGGIVGGTYENQFGVPVRCRQDFGNIGFESVGQGNFPMLHGIDSVQDVVHSIGGRKADDVVPVGLTKGPEDQVQDLITAIAQHYLVLQCPLEFGQKGPQASLVRIGISVHTIFKGVLIGVQ